MRTRFLRALMSAVASTPKNGPPVVVRQCMHADTAHLQVQLQPASSHGALRVLLRPASETLEKTLGRLEKTLSKKSKKGAASGEPAPALAAEIVLCDALGEAIARSTNAVDAWSSASTLRIGAERLRVLFDPPEVTSLECPVVPLVGIPIGPLAATRNCELSHCQFIWERR
jgi:hypothetical protein